MMWHQHAILIAQYLCGGLGLGKYPNIWLEWTRAQHFPFKLHPCSPMPTHRMTFAHPCPPTLFKLRPCIQKLCNVYYPLTPSLGWIGQIKGCSLLLALARSASWLEA